MEEEKAVTMYFSDDLHELKLNSCTWTLIKTNQIKPPGRHSSSLNMILDDKLVLHCGADSDNTELSDTWILDLPTQTWTQYASDKDHPRLGHTSSRGLDNNVIIIGGLYDWLKLITTGNNYASWYKTVFHMIVEPKSLQHLTLQIICKHKTVLPWQCLPNSLVHLLNVQETAEVDDNNNE